MGPVRAMLPGTFVTGGRSWIDALRSEVLLGGGCHHGDAAVRVPREVFQARSDQTHCSARVCQWARRRNWQRATTAVRELGSPPGTPSRSAAWAEANPGYWREYAHASRVHREQSHYVATPACGAGRKDGRVKGGFSGASCAFRVLPDGTDGFWRRFQERTDGGVWRFAADRGVKAQSIVAVVGPLHHSGGVPHGLRGKLFRCNALPHRTARRAPPQPSSGRYPKRTSTNLESSRPVRHTGESLVLGKQAFDTQNSLGKTPAVSSANSFRNR